MSEQVKENCAPLQHLAVIMDGNGRWAKKQGLPRIAGHQQGVQTVVKVVDECLQVGIRYLSLFAFSSENWGRPQQEVDALMELLLQFLASQRQKMLDGSIRLRVIGDRSRLSASVRRALTEAEADTAGGSALTMVLALSYGGRDEILRAAKQLAEKVSAGLDLQTVDDDLFAQFLDTQGIPEPDLLIRTSGEKRISNFLLWQVAYAELYFTDVLWPDFDAQELHRALEDYRQRKRRFGLTDDQLMTSGSDLSEGESH
ncbi:isoprenyl transferase [Malonomonas rubra]|uniref:isoprenyl transferase n=1 Tax=Malonomonas rubra TaxID=57040 RepID=UPI0026EFEF86|nr:isoprenyl transferase [Malonomonas rubra]